ncbi:MAG: OmpA family protein [Bacteroidales bacterium]|jgi:outer membrane protein OmpA-like peptidoglycan-associated protein|nr:OmpA family protein [Bacteroidales bacterium]
MKKVTVYTLLLSAAGLFSLNSSSSLYAQEVEQPNPYKHWSVGLSLSTNKLEAAGDFEYLKNMGSVFAVEVERTFNPLWGFALHFGNFHYKDSRSSGKANEISGIARLNMANLASKYRPGGWKKLDVFGHLGGGVSFYSAAGKDETLTVPVGLSLEYNVSPSIVVSLIGDRRWHLSPNMGLATSRQERAAIWSAGVGLRIKFGKSDHVRNVALTDYEARYAKETAPAVQQSYDDAVLKKEIENNTGNIRRLQEQLQQAQDKLNQTNESLNKAKSELEQVKQNPSPSPSPNSSQHTYSERQPVAQQSQQLKASDFYPEDPELSTGKRLSNTVWAFPVGVAEVSSVPQDILDLLKAQPAGTKIYLVGHTDNSGTEEINTSLSQERAKTVKNLLVQEGFAADKIIIKGASSSKPVVSNDSAAGRRQNRRVEFILVTP